MEEKYLRFYLSFHKAFQDKESNHCLRTLSDSRVVSLAKLIFR